MPNNEILSRNALHPEAPDAGSAPMLELVKSLWEDSRRVNRRRFNAQKDELAYSLRLQHFLYDTGNQRDQRLLQPHGPELYSLLRHKWSSICKVNSYLECRPQSPDDSPDMAEDAKIALESVLNDPKKLYGKLRRRWVMGALSARAWVLAFDYNPGIGPYGGEIGFRLVPDWNFHTAPGWQDHHDETCPWVGEEATMRLGDVLRMKKYGWKVDGVMPDSRVAQAGPGTGLPAPLGNSNQFDTRSGGSSSAVDLSETEVVTVLKWMFRQDEATEEVTQAPYQLPPQEQFGECLACGHQDPMVARDEWGQVQDNLGACPNCQKSQLLPVRQAQNVDIFAKYPDGRMVIAFPNCGVVAYDGPWLQKLRSYPYMRLRCYDHPEEQVGQSDVSVHWTSQQLLNGLRRFGWEQMRRNVDITMLPKTGLENARGAPFRQSDLHGQIGFYTDVQAMSQVQHFQGSGLPAALLPFHSMIADQFRQAAGITDLGLTQSESKDIPVGTVKQLTQTAEIPVQDHIQAIQEEESIGFGVLLDMIVQTWGDERPARYLGPDGSFRVKRLRGALLSSMEVMVTASPSLSSMKSEELQTIMQWTQLMAVDPAAAMIAAEANNIPPSYVRRYMQMKQAMAAPAATVAPQPPGAPSPPAKNGNGSSSNGIPPAVAARMHSMGGASAGVGGQG